MSRNNNSTSTTSLTLLDQLAMQSGNILAARFPQEVHRWQKKIQLVKMATDQRKGPLVGKYLDPIEYSRQVLKIAPIPVIQEMLRSLYEPPFRVLTKSAHGLGKTNAAAIAINHFFDTYDPSIVISTAPTQMSVCDVLWAEVRLQRLRAGLPDRFIGPSAPCMRTAPDHYAKGFTARKGESFQGRHKLRMLFVVDEAVGVDPIFWQNFMSMFQPGLHSWLAICNPTDTTSEAYLQESRGGWRTFTLSAFDHPNIVAELRGEPPPIPEAVRLAQVKEWLRDWTTPINRERESLIVQDGRVLDIEFPPGSGNWFRPGPVAEARLLGRWPSMGTNGVWSDSLWETAVRNELPIPITEPPEIGCDCASHGVDFTSIFVRWGPCGLHHEEANGWDHVRTAGRLVELAKKYAAEANSRRQPQAAPIKADEIRIKIDDDGTGGGVISILRNHGMNVSAIGACTPAIRSSWYPNKRSELWFEVADRAKIGQLDLSRLPPETRQKLKSQAMVVEWTLDAAGRRVVEPKDITKKKLGRSPDAMDSLNLAWYSGMRFEAPKAIEEPPRRSVYDRMSGRSSRNF